jgi:hypothetical protein
MSIMFSQTTRLELVIVVAALLVLLLCRQPPKSGNAGIRSDVELTLQEPARRTEDEGQKTDDVAIPDPPSATGELQTQDSQPAMVNPPSDGMTSDNNTTEPAAPPRPKMKRIGVVDARGCSDLNYKDVMYGDITVRWVWNGQEFVPRKVCEVREKSGAVSTWIFGERSDVILSEIQQEVP